MGPRARGEVAHLLPSSTYKYAGAPTTLLFSSLSLSLSPLAAASTCPVPARTHHLSPLRSAPRSLLSVAATGLRSVRRDGVWRVRGGGGGGGPRGGASGGRGGAGGAGASRAGGRGGVRAHDEEGQELPPAQAPGARQVLRAGGITCSAPPPLVWFWFR